MFSPTPIAEANSFGKASHIRENMLRILESFEKVSPLRVVQFGREDMSEADVHLSARPEAIDLYIYMYMYIYIHKIMYDNPMATV